MALFIETKIIQGEAMDKKTFEETIRNPGSKYEAANEEGYKVVYPDGETSWSPKAFFEKRSRLVNAGELELIYMSV